MNSRDKNLLLLHYCCSGNYQLIKKFHSLDPSFSSIYTISAYDLHHHLRIRKDKAEYLVKLFKRVTIDEIIKEFNRKGICYTTVFSDNYPPLLKKIYDPPWILYYTGNSSLLTNSPALSVVGTRHPSAYAKHELQEILSEELCERLVIISGLALGIDGLAHKIAIEKKGRTAAVLGYGFDHIYPKAHTELLQQMKKEQLLISEYPPYVRPQKWHFPERNRIISGLSKATFVVEAKDRSGSLITSELALQQGRDVFALPGRISQSTSTGTNKLIQDGAKMILCSNDILEEYFTFVL